MGGATLDNSFTTKYENEPCKTGERVEHGGLLVLFISALHKKHTLLSDRGDC